MYRKQYLLLTMLVTLSLLIASKPAARIALADDTAVAPEFANDRLLVQFAPGLATENEEGILDLIGGEISHEYSLVPGLALVQLGSRNEIDVPTAIALLGRREGVDYAEPDYWVAPQDKAPNDPLPNDPLMNDLWGMADIHAPAAWLSYTGSNDLVIAVIDMGADIKHPDLVHNIWINPDEIPENGLDDDNNGYVDDINGWDFYFNDSVPEDAGTHGTHVAGTICAEGNNGIGVVGVVWQCQIMVLKFMDSTGGFTSGAIMALEYAVNKGARISNNSWGNPSYSASLYSAIQNAQSIDHTFIAASGNDGRNIDVVPFYPASYDLENVITVAAIKADESGAAFSNYGDVAVDFHAPGVSVWSSTPNNTYGIKSGTSMAAPHAAGVAALVLGVRPTLAYPQLRYVLLHSVRPASWLAGLSATSGIIDAELAANTVRHLPAEPSDLTATSATNSITLAWVDNSADETAFVVLRTTDGVVWQTIANLSPNTTGFLDSGLADGEYRYRVQAINQFGPSAYSNLAAAVVGKRSMHVADLDGSAEWVSRNKWTATITILVQDQFGSPVPNARVTGSWSSQNSGEQLPDQRSGDLHSNCEQAEGDEHSGAVFHDKHNCRSIQLYTWQ